MALTTKAPVASTAAAGSPRIVTATLRFEDKALALRFPDDVTVARVKEDLEKALGLGAPNMDLSHEGRSLRDDMLISACNLPDKAELVATVVYRVSEVRRGHAVDFCATNHGATCFA